MNFRLCAFADESSNDFSGQIAALKKHGLSGLEIRNLDGKNVADLSVSEAKAIRRRLEDEGLCVWSVGSRIGKIGIRDAFAPHLDELKHTLELAEALGTDKMRIFSFFIPNGDDPEVYKDEVMERLERFTLAARGSGIKLCHENEKEIYGDTAKRCLEIAETFEEIGIIYDPANFIQCSEDTLAAWDMLEKRIVYMHIKDALADGRIVPAGHGEGRIPELLRRYAAIGGEVLTLEPHLYGFEGLGALERRTVDQMDFPYLYKDGESAFGAAVDALRKLIG